MAKKSATQVKPIEVIEETEFDNGAEPIESESAFALLDSSSKNEPEPEFSKVVKPGKAAMGAGPKKKPKQVKEFPDGAYAVTYGGDHPDAQKPLSIEQIMDLMGMEVTDNPDIALFRDLKGDWIHCAKNLTNRPFYLDNALSIMQERLRGKWGLNGETFIIGEYGNVLNGQHTGVGFYLAEQERTIGANAAYWRKRHPKPITCERVVVYGVSEDDDVVNTIGTGRIRSLKDVLYRDSMFAHKIPSERKKAAAHLDKALRLLWDRTKAVQDPYAPRKTFSESIDFVERHRRILDAIAHIMEEDVTVQGEDHKALSRYLNPGYMAAIFYMMAGSETDTERYKDARREGTAKNPIINFDCWDKAEEFFALLAAGREDKVLKCVRDARRPGIEKGEKGGLIFGTGPGSGSMAEKVNTLIAAWNTFVKSADAEAPVKPRDIMLRYVVTDDGDQILAHGQPKLGGIDLGTEEEKESEPEPDVEKTSDSPIKPLKSRKAADRGEEE